MKSYADAHCDTVVKAMEAGENMLEFSGQLNLEKLAAYGSVVQIFAIWLEPIYFMGKKQIRDSIIRTLDLMNLLKEN